MRGFVYLFINKYRRVLLTIMPDTDKWTFGSAGVANPVLRLPIWWLE